MEYGIDETMTLLVPDAKGGASVPLSQSSTAMSKVDPQIQSMIPQLYDAFPQYFGTQPGTSGPVYVGAFVLFLFILGLFVVKGYDEVGTLSSYHPVRSSLMGP